MGYASGKEQEGGLSSDRPELIVVGLERIEEVSDCSDDYTSR